MRSRHTIDQKLGPPPSVGVHPDAHCYLLLVNTSYCCTGAMGFLFLEAAIPNIPQANLVQVQSYDRVFG